MNKANKKKKRVRCDYYPTPLKDIRTFLDFYKIEECSILDPAAGTGNFERVLKEYGHNINNIDCVEMQWELERKLAMQAKNVIIADYLKWEPTKKYDLIITNPPYGKAMEYVEKALREINENGKVIMLLRTAFLETQKRYKEFWSKENNKLSGLYTLAQRPSFTGRGTDATSYSWFVWDKSTDKQEIRPIM